MKMYHFLVSAMIIFSSGLAVAAEYTVDGVHSTVGFRAKHLGVSYFHGQFAKVSGKLRYDASKPEGSSIEISVD